MLVLVDMLALAAQATSFVVWPLLDNNKSSSLWLIPPALVLVSCRWWENYVSIQSPFSEYINASADTLLLSTVQVI